MMFWKSVVFFNSGLIKYKYNGEQVYCFMKLADVINTVDMNWKKVQIKRRRFLLKMFVKHRQQFILLLKIKKFAGQIWI